MSTIARLITTDDIEIVRCLAMQIWPKTYNRNVAPDHIDSMVSALFDPDTMEDDMTLRGHKYWVMRVGHADVGFVAAHRYGTRIWITKLCVLPDFRGFGLASQLIKAVQAEFAPAKDMVICVHKDHSNAVDFCLKSGFSIDREIPSDLGTYGFTDYVMHKDLHSEAANALRYA